MTHAIAGGLRDIRRPDKRGGWVPKFENVVPAGTGTHSVIRSAMSSRLPRARSMCLSSERRSLGTRRSDTPPVRFSQSVWPRAERCPLSSVRADQCARPDPIGILLCPTSARRCSTDRTRQVGLLRLSWRKSAAADQGYTLIFQGARYSRVVSLLASSSPRIFLLWDPSEFSGR